VYGEINYFFDEIFDGLAIDINLILPMSFDDVKNIINKVLETFDINDPLDI